MARPSPLGNPQKEHNDPLNMDARLGSPIMQMHVSLDRLPWISCGFSKTHLARNKVGVHGGWCTPLPLYAIWLSQPLYPINTAAWVSSLCALFCQAKWLHGCDVPLSWNTSQGCSSGQRDLLSTTDLCTSLVRALSKLWLDCIPGDSPLEQGCSLKFENSHLRLRDPFLPKAERPFICNRSSVSD